MNEVQGSIVPIVPRIAYSEMHKEMKFAILLIGLYHENNLSVK